MKQIDTEQYSHHLRTRSVDVDGHRVLISRVGASEQGKDLTEPAVCQGFGRIRHFKLNRHQNWTPNPLPIAPAVRALGQSSTDQINALVYQNAACNWRCWYCYVPFPLLTASRTAGEWKTAEELVKMYAVLQSRPPILDLSGGQPDLSPEWILWTMQSLLENGLSEVTYLWSDDNLSVDYFWRYLTDSQIDFIASYVNYGKVCCFKGYNETSFSFNTRAAPRLFKNQQHLFQRLLQTGIDLFGYITLTTPDSADVIAADIPRFLDNLQRIAESLPLRIVPLHVDVFSPVQSRLDSGKHDAMKAQEIAHYVWATELKKRFGSAQLDASICDIQLTPQNNKRAK